MINARRHITCDGRKVEIRNLLLFTERSDDGGYFRVVSVGHAREEVMLDLIVETTVHKAQERAAYIGGRDNLIV